MSVPRVLSVGQCGYDHGRISAGLRAQFGAVVVSADTQDEAVAALRAGRFDLVLVNRVADLDGAPGLDLIRGLKTDPELARVPVMLVSNYAEAQDEAVSLGALRGFGKADLDRPTTRERVAAVLGAGTPG